MKKFIALASICALGACASITNDETVPVALSFSDGSEGTCTLQNKRITMEADIPLPQEYAGRMITSNTTANQTMVRQP